MIRVVVPPVVASSDPVEIHVEAIRDALIAREVRMARPVQVAVRAGGEDWRFYVHHRREPRAVAAIPNGASSAA
ncbi:hypothetical protein HQQ80_20510 [Microbacteriaceae bacterium VKM Ac-2855]|nr:hypothetical protein [Microbacteriaceae bacterium VKM Ac-2855]